MVGEALSKRPFWARLAHEDPARHRVLSAKGAATKARQLAFERAQISLPLTRIDVAAVILVRVGRSRALGGSARRRALRAIQAGDWPSDVVAFEASTGDRVAFERLQFPPAGDVLPASPRPSRPLVLPWPLLVRE